MSAYYADSDDNEYLATATVLDPRSVSFFTPPPLQVLPPLLMLPLLLILAALSVEQMAANILIATSGVCSMTLCNVGRYITRESIDRIKEK
jgi:hypothetical protein